MAEIIYKAFEFDNLEAVLGFDPNTKAAKESRKHTEVIMYCDMQYEINRGKKFYLVAGYNVNNGKVEIEGVLSPRNHSFTEAQIAELNNKKLTYNN